MVADSICLFIWFLSGRKRPCPRVFTLDGWMDDIFKTVNDINKNAIHDRIPFVEGMTHPWWVVWKDIYFADHPGKAKDLGCKGSFKTHFCIPPVNIVQLLTVGSGPQNLLMERKPAKTFLVKVMSENDGIVSYIFPFVIIEVIICQSAKCIQRVPSFWTLGYHNSFFAKVKKYYYYTIVVASVTQHLLL